VSLGARSPKAPKASSIIVALMVMVNSAHSLLGFMEATGWVDGAREGRGDEEQLIYGPTLAA
jgi:hypothetical protein